MARPKSNGSSASSTANLGFEAHLVDFAVALPGQLFYSTQIPVCLPLLAKNKSADAQRGFLDRRQLTDAGLAVRLTTMENKA